MPWVDDEEAEATPAGGRWVDDTTQPSAEQPGWLERVKSVGVGMTEAGGAAGGALGSILPGGDPTGTAGRVVGSVLGAAATPFAAVGEAARSAATPVGRGIGSLLTKLGPQPAAEGMFTAEQPLEPGATLSEEGKQATVEAMGRGAGEAASILAPWKGPQLAGNWLTQLAARDNLITRWVHDVAPSLGMVPVKLSRIQAGGAVQERLGPALTGVNQHADSSYAAMRALGNEHARGMETVWQTIREEAPTTLKWIEDHVPGGVVPAKVRGVLEEAAGGGAGPAVRLGGDVLDPALLTRLGVPESAATRTPTTLPFGDAHGLANKLDEAIRGMTDGVVKGGVKNFIGTIRRGLQQSVEGTPAAKALEEANNHYSKVVIPFRDFVDKWRFADPTALHDHLHSLVRNGNVEELTRLFDATGEVTKSQFAQKYLKSILDQARTTKGELDYKKFADAMLGSSTGREKLLDGHTALWGEDAATLLHTWAGRVEEIGGKPVTGGVLAARKALGTIIGWNLPGMKAVGGGLALRSIGGLAGRSVATEINTEFLSRVLMDPRAAYMLRQGMSTVGETPLAAVLTDIAAKMPPPHPGSQEYRQQGGIQP